MINVLILEDDDYTRKFVEKIVLENPLIEETYETASANDAIKYASEYYPNIVLLDIKLDEKENLNGLEVAKLIKKIRPKTKFIFLTGYCKYAIESFEVHPYDYILKPINIGKLRKTISTLAKGIYGKLEDDNKKLILKNGKEIYLLSYEDIIFIEKQGRKVLIHNKSNQYEARETLRELEKELDENFIRVHKSFIVNKNKIEQIKDIGNRTYEIGFQETNETAFISRYKFTEIKNEIIS